MDNYIEFVKTNGINLKDMGICSYILGYDNAIKALEILKNNKIPILGGDLYVKNGNKFETSSESWYCNQIHGEPRNNYALRSYIKAIDYLKIFEPQKDKYYYDIVAEIDKQYLLT